MVPSHILVRFADRGGLYSYHNHVPDLAKGDLVVVELDPHGDFKDRFTVGEVMDVDPLDKEKVKATKRIVCRVDIEPYNALESLAPLEQPKLKLKPKPSFGAAAGLAAHVKYMQFQADADRQAFEDEMTRHEGETK